MEDELLAPGLCVEFRMTTPRGASLTRTGCPQECQGLLRIILHLSVSKLSATKSFGELSLSACLWDWQHRLKMGRRLPFLFCPRSYPKQEQCRMNCPQSLDQYLLHVNPRAPNSESAHMQLQRCAGVCLVSFNRCKPSHFLSQYRLKRPHKLAFPHGRVAFDLPLLAHLLQVLHLRTSRLTGTELPSAHTLPAVLAIAIAKHGHARSVQGSEAYTGASSCSAHNQMTSGTDRLRTPLRQPKVDRSNSTAHPIRDDT